MKNLFATVSYSFNNFYNNLNTQGQMIFSIIMFLIILLCIILFITYVIQEIQTKAKLKKIKNNKDKNISSPKDNKEEIVKIVKVEEKEPLYTSEKTEIEDIASAISSALEEEKPISLTNFEEDQEKTAIISIDELMRKAKKLELIEDEEPSGVNYLEKYNLEPAEVEAVIGTTMDSNPNAEVKAFKVSQIISPIYGVKKEVIDNNDTRA